MNVRFRIGESAEIDLIFDRTAPLLRSYKLSTRLGNNKYILYGMFYKRTSKFPSFHCGWQTTAENTLTLSGL